jgi:tRNA nucleotidyltransferase (CCA-adding enzyme)
VNIVPCYKVEQGEWISATDRTPFHTDYIKLHLDEQMEEEVRLLKRFMKGVDVYGAEIKVGGFSGYLCELLVLNYGTFIEVLRSAANWKERTVIDYEKNYENVDAKKIFEEPLVMVDPVDKARNVAAAVKKEMLYEFIAASRKFLKKPGMNFFYPPETEALNITDLANKIKTRGSTIIFIKFGGTTAVPDVLWGQLYKSLRSLRKIIQRHDWKVLREDVWSDEKKLSIFVFEVENQFRPNMKRHLGPPLSRRKDCEKFLQKHIEADSTVSGPRVENGQWIVYVNSKFTDVVKMLKETLKNGGKNIGVAELVSKAIADSSEILVNNEVGKLYSSSPEFAKFLTRYLKGKPLWLT